MSIIEVLFFPVILIFWVLEHIDVIFWIMCAAAVFLVLLWIFQPLFYMIGGILEALAESVTGGGGVSCPPSNEYKAAAAPFIEAAKRRQEERKERRKLRLERNKHKRELLKGQRKRYKARQKGKLLPYEAGETTGETVVYSESVSEDGILRPDLLQQSGQNDREQCL